MEARANELAGINSFIFKNLLSQTHPQTGTPFGKMIRTMMMMMMMTTKITKVKMFLLFKNLVYF